MHMDQSINYLYITRTTSRTVGPDDEQVVAGAPSDCSSRLELNYLCSELRTEGYVRILHCPPLGAMGDYQRAKNVVGVQQIACGGKV